MARGANLPLVLRFVCVQVPSNQHRELVCHGGLAMIAICGSQGSPQGSCVSRDGLRDTGENERNGETVLFLLSLWSTLPASPQSVYSETRQAAIA
jgi:hypothetical protein